MTNGKVEACGLGTDFRMCFIDGNFCLIFVFQKHFDICPKFPVLRTNKCGGRDIPRGKVCFVTLGQTRRQHLVC